VSSGAVALLALVAALAALGLAAALLVRGGGKPANRALAAALLSLGLSEAGEGLALIAGPGLLFWRRFALAATLVLPAALFWTAAALRDSPSRPDRGARKRAILVSAIALVLLLFSFSGAVLFPAFLPDGRLVLALAPLGRLIAGFLIVSLALGLAQFESMLQAAAESARYRLKFVLVGLGTGAVYPIFLSSQMLLRGLGRSDPALGGAAAVLIAVGLVAWGLGRGHMQQALSGIYVTPRIVYGSASFLVVGFYLLAVGFVGELLRQAGRPLGASAAEIVVLLGLVALVALLLSRRAGVEFRTFVSRHFYRQRYDYREMWLEVTDAFEGCGTAEAVLDRFIELLGHTFATGRIAVWLRYEADGAFHQARSTNIEEPPAPLGEGEALVRALGEGEGIVDEEAPSRAAAAARAEAPDPDARRTEAPTGLSVAIRGQDALLGFLSVGPVRGRPRYETDDRNLLRAIAHHAGVVLTQVRLAEERRAAAELEALHRVSAFCVHDLKTLASRLSLLAHNAGEHGEDPRFRESAYRTVGKTAREMLDLVERLAGRVSRPGVEPVDVGEVVADTVAAMSAAVAVSVEHPSRQLPKVALGRDELRQVLANLIQNAAEAVRESRTGGEELIVVRAEPVEGAVWVTVADRGPGIAAAALGSIFQPFRTTKSAGLGLGLYECKRIVEANRGVIRVFSEPGQGTRIRLELPVWKGIVPAESGRPSEETG